MTDDLGDVIHVIEVPHLHPGPLAHVTGHGNLRKHNIVRICFRYRHVRASNKKLIHRRTYCNCNCYWGTCIAPATRSPRAHHRVNRYLGARRQNETNMFSDHNETSPSIAQDTRHSVQCSVFSMYASDWAKFGDSLDLCFTPRTHVQCGAENFYCNFLFLRLPNICSYALRLDL